MDSNDTRAEMEEYLGIVPGWMETIPPAASEHSWGVFRDLVLGETELTAREKSLIGVGVAAAIGCPYCSHFHGQEASLADVGESEREEAVAVAGSTRYFSTLLHGNETDLDEFRDETTEIVEHIRTQASQQAGAD